MRILQVTDFYPPVLGGLENHVHDLTRALHRAGHEVAVATLSTDARTGPGVRHYPIATASSRAIHYAEARRPFHPPLPDPRARHQLTAALDEFRPDVVHGHSWLTVSLPARATRSLVFTAHDYALVCQLRTLLTTRGSVCSGPGLAKCVRCAMRAPGSVRHPAMTVGTRVGRHLLRPREIIAVSGRVRAELAGFAAAPITVIPNFMDEHLAVAVDEPTEPARRDVVFFAGDPGWHKGLQVMARCWSGRARPAVPLTLALTRPDSSPLPSGVHATRLTRTETLAAIREALCVIVPSVWKDPSPTVAIEALTMGTPVIASAVGGLPEIVQHEVNGLLVPPDDDEALGAAITRLVNDPGLHARLVRGARATAAGFSSASIVPRITEVYERVRAPRAP